MGCASSVPIHLINYNKQDREIFLKKKYKFFARNKPIQPILKASLSTANLPQPTYKKNNKLSIIIPENHYKI